MSKDHNKALLVVGLVSMLAILVPGCMEGEDEVSEGDITKGEASIGYVLWDGEIASTNVLKQVYEQVGYEVDIIAVDAGPLYQGLANGDFDFTVSSWLPVTQKGYWDKYGDQIDYVGPNLEGCKCGLVVPSYVTIDSIEELNSVKDNFNGEIMGIEPGAGIMQNTEDAIEAYDLDFELKSSSSAAMATSLKKSVDNGEWIVVTLWSPHWAFNRWDLKYLDDPLRIYGEGEKATTLARKGLKEEKPEVYGIASRFEWSQDDIQSVMTDIEDGMSEEEAASKWIANNPDKVAEWIGENK